MYTCAKPKLKALINKEYHPFKVSVSFDISIEQSNLFFYSQACRVKIHVLEICLKKFDAFWVPCWCGWVVSGAAFCERRLVLLIFILIFLPST
jgi:hypothetical protein